MGLAESALPGHLKLAGEAGGRPAQEGEAQSALAKQSPDLIVFGLFAGLLDVGTLGDDAQPWLLPQLKIPFG